MFRSLAAIALLGAALTSAGCSNDEPPVTVPLSAPTPPELAPRATADPAPVVEDSGAAPGVGTYASGAGRGPAVAGTSSAKAGGRSIHGCCNALDSAAKGASTDASRKLYEQATRVCYQKANQILQGTVTLEQALAQVRSSLIGAAPSQCY